MRGSDQISGSGAVRAVPTDDGTSYVPVTGLDTNFTRKSANFTRPADTTAYASGDLVANSTTAGSVAALSFTTIAAAAGKGMIRRVLIRKSGTGVTNAAFRLHLFTIVPTISVSGDNGVFASSVTGVAGYIGAIDVTVDRAFLDGAAGTGVPLAGSEIGYVLAAASTTLYGLLEARGAYTPASAEVFTIVLENYEL